MENKVKKLVLNKEAIIYLQDKQMQALVGGEVLVSNGATSSYTCGIQCYPPVGTIDCMTVPITSTVPDIPASCCKKTCNG